MNYIDRIRNQSRNVCINYKIFQNTYYINLMQWTVNCLDIFLIFMKYTVESENIQYYQNNQNEEANFIINSGYIMV